VQTRFQLHPRRVGLRNPRARRRASSHDVQPAFHGARAAPQGSTGGAVAFVLGLGSRARGTRGARSWRAAPARECGLGMGSTYEHRACWVPRGARSRPAAPPRAGDPRAPSACHFGSSCCADRGRRRLCSTSQSVLRPASDRSSAVAAARSPRRTVARSRRFERSLCSYLDASPRARCLCPLGRVSPCVLRRGVSGRACASPSCWRLEAPRRKRNPHLSPFLQTSRPPSPEGPRGQRPAPFQRGRWLPSQSWCPRVRQRRLPRRPPRERAPPLHPPISSHLRPRSHPPPGCSPVCH
jgi:hypothetical protein